jgi:hypothetical protein
MSPDCTAKDEVVRVVPPDADVQFEAGSLDEMNVGAAIR